MYSAESQLRHPLERPLVWIYAVLNALLMAAALFVVFEGSNWLQGHPRLNAYKGRIRALAIVAVIGLPSTVFLRNTRHALIRGKSIELSPDQLPEIYSILGHCEKRGMSPLPELYVSDMSMPTFQHGTGASADYARAMSSLTKLRRRATATQRTSSVGCTNTAKECGPTMLGP